MIILNKLYFFRCKIHLNSNCITLIKIKCQNFVILAILFIWPRTSIRTYHICTMTCITIRELIVITFYDISMAHSYSDPTWLIIFKTEFKLFKISSSFNIRRHYSKSITICSSWLDCILIYDLYLFSFPLWSKFIFCFRCPYIYLIHIFISFI